MANNTTSVHTVSNILLWCSVVFKFIAMIIGVLGNVTVIIYIFFSRKEKTATSYLIGHLAITDLLVCLAIYPTWIIEFLQTIIGIEGDQELFCKLGRPIMLALTFASVAAVLAITVDRYLYFLKPMRYPTIVTCRRVFLTVLGIWFTVCCFFTVLHLQFRRRYGTKLGLCALNTAGISYFKKSFLSYIPLILIFYLNFQIFGVARKQRKRILAEIKTVTVKDDSEGESTKNMSVAVQFFVALKAAKTFAIVFAVLTFCILTPTVVAHVLIGYGSVKSKMVWFTFFQYDIYGMNSIVNAYIYGMRHVKWRKGYAHILFKLLSCRKPAN